MRKGLALFLSLFLGQVAFGANVDQSARELFADRAEIGGERITIKQAVSRALSDNFQVVNAQKTKEIYESQLTAARSNYYPSLSLDATYTRALKKSKIVLGSGSPMGSGMMEIGQNNTYKAGLNASYVLWSGGQVRNSVRLAKVGRETGVYNLWNVQQSVARDVVKFCYDVIYASALIRVQEEYLSIAKQHLAETRAKYKEGLASNLDVLNQKVKVENIEPLVLQAKKNFELGNLYLRQILNRDPEDTLYLTWTPEDMLLPKTEPLEELYKRAIENRPELKLAKLAADAAYYQVKIVRSGHMPTLALFGDYTYNAATEHGLPQHRTDYYWSSNAGVQFSLPLFEGGRVSSQVTQKELEYEQQMTNYQNALKNVRIQVKDAWLNLEEARTRIEATKGVVDQARKNLTAQMKRYRAGLASQLELNDATANVNQSDLQYVQAVYDGATALADLKFAVGAEVN